jgi:omega-amidase
MTGSGTIRIALVQKDIALLEPEKNRAELLDIAAQEAQSGVTLVVFPELSLTGYVEPLAPGLPLTTGQDFSAFRTDFHAAAEPLDGPTVTALSDLSDKTGCCFIVGLALRDDSLSGRLTNASVFVRPRCNPVAYAKIHLWHSEKHFFAEGNGLTLAPSPVGRIGMQICYDIRFPEVTRGLALGGAELVSNIWASFRLGDAPVADTAQFRHRAYTRAQENGVFFLSCNRVGRQGEARFLGHSVVCGPDGLVLAEAPHEDETVLRVDLDLADVARYRGFVGLFNDRRPAAYAPLTIGLA